jgi:hypothetical protein
MFGFFKKKEASIKVISRIWMTDAALHAALYSAWEKDNTLHIACWFEDTWSRLTAFFTRHAASSFNIILARELSAHIPKDRLIFTEHHPLPQKEQDLFEKLHLKEALVWTSLESPLLKYFGGERISGLMQKLGADEKESLEHPMIHKAIRNAQDKIAAGLTIEQSAQSPEEWLARNYTR